MLYKGFESPFISLHVVRKVQNGCSALLKNANIYENTLCETKMESVFGMATFYSSTRSSQSFSLGRACPVIMMSGKYTMHYYLYFIIFKRLLARALLCYWHFSIASGFSWF